MSIPYHNQTLDLLQASLARGERLRLLVRGDSMLPILRPGDHVLVEAADPASLAPGDLVLVRHDWGLVTHRLVGVDARGWHARGDNRRWCDAPVPAAALLGRALAVERAGRSYDLRTPRRLLGGRLRAAWGRLLLRLKSVIH